MIRRAFLLLLLAGCGPEGDAGLTPSAERRCLAGGGTVAAVVVPGETQCTMPASDAGKSCGVASDCLGFCDPDTFTCSADLSRSGCYSYLDDAGEEQRLCAE